MALNEIRTYEVCMAICRCKIFSFAQWLFDIVLMKRYEGWYTSSINVIYNCPQWRYNSVINIAMASQITSLTIVYSFIQAKIKESIKLHVTGLCDGNSPVTGALSAQMASNAGKMFPFDDVIMESLQSAAVSETSTVMCGPHKYIAIY